MNNRVLLFGALIGAATGLVAALMLQRRAERTGTEISLSAGEGIQLEVTDAQTELTRARTLLVSATYDYMTTYAQLQRALGTDVSTPPRALQNEVTK